MSTGQAVHAERIARAALMVRAAAGRSKSRSSTACTSVPRAWSTLGRLLDPITQDACSFFEDHGLFDDYTGVVLDVEEGKRIAHALGDNKAAILRNHGLLTVGGFFFDADFGSLPVVGALVVPRGPRQRRGRCGHQRLDATEVDPGRMLRMMIRGPVEDKIREKLVDKRPAELAAQVLAQR